MYRTFSNYLRKTRCLVFLSVLFVLLLFLWGYCSRRPAHIIFSVTSNGDSHRSDIFPITAYLEPNRASVRIFFMKRPEADVHLKCYIQLPSKDLEPSRLSSSQVFGNDEPQYASLTEYGGVYRGYVTFCEVPHQIGENLTLHSSMVGIQENVNGSPVFLSIWPGRLLEQNNQIRFRHHFAMCMTPFFNTGSFTPNFLIEYIELQRRLGITLLALYLAEQPTAGVKKVIESYRNQPALMPDESIEIRTVPWNLPVPNPSETTWYYDQVLSFNDCLHRLANDTEYIFYGDLDEIFIPDRHLGLNKSTLPTWFDVISAVTGDYGPSHPTLCFPSRFFPPMLEITSNNENIFARTIATVETYPERRKCLVRTQDVEEVYVHWPVKPSVMRLAESLGVIFHYRTCLRKGYIPCELSTKYSVNTQLQPYRDAVRRSVEFRLKSL